MHRKRLCIYPKDVALITGKGIKTAQKLLRDIRIVYQKKNHQFITLKEFSEYTGIELEEVRKVFEEGVTKEQRIY
jgi:hypothetical protein